MMTRLVQVILLVLWGSMALMVGACAVPPAGEGQPVSPVQTAAEAGLPLSPLASPTVAHTATPSPSTTPSPLPPIITRTPTPTPSLTPTPTDPYEIEPDREGTLRFTFYRPPETAINAPPASHIMYTTADIPYGVTTTLWLAEVGDVRQKYAITTFPKRFYNLVSEFILSPDENYVAYVGDLRGNAFEAKLEVLNLTTSRVHLLDLTAFIRRRGGRTVLWKPDSTALAYVEPTGELNLYYIETDQKQYLTHLNIMSGTLPTGFEDIVLIDWLTPDTLLYASMEDGESWDIRSIDTINGHITHLANFEGWDFTNAILSPDQSKILVATKGCPLLILDPQGEVSHISRAPCSRHDLWHPDSQGVLSSSGEALSAMNLNPLTGNTTKEAMATEVVLTSPLSAYPLSWRVDGRYLFYKDRIAKEGLLLDVETGQTQVIGPDFFIFVGWVGGE